MPVLALPFGHRWVHWTVHTRCSWLHGDARGFRSRSHRIHSSGDYKNPPPLTEHAGLRRFHRERSKAPTRFTADARPVIVEAFLIKLQQRLCTALAIAVADNHVHVLTTLPTLHCEADKILAAVKQRASHAVRDVLPGRLFAQGPGSVVNIRDRSHHVNVFHYICLKQGRDAAVWTFKDGLFRLEADGAGAARVEAGAQPTRAFAQTSSSVKMNRKPKSECSENSASLTDQTAHQTRSPTA